MTCLACFAMSRKMLDIYSQCCVAKWFWKEVSEIINFPVGSDFESIGKLWLSDKRFKTVNVLTSAALWILWKIRNEMCFQGLRWTGTGILLRRLTQTLLDCRLLHKEEDAKQLKRWARELERRSLLLSRLRWEELGPGANSYAVNGMVLNSFKCNEL
jgi:hypothetical protein